MDCKNVVIPSPIKNYGVSCQIFILLNENTKNKIAMGKKKDVFIPKMKNSFELFTENSVQNLHHQAATKDKSKIVRAQPHNTGLLNEYVLL